MTFETIAVSETDMRERIKEIIDSGNPAYVVEVDGKMAGYCYMHLWKERAAYSFSKEVSIYLHKDIRGKGIEVCLLLSSSKIGSIQKIHMS